MGWWRLLWGWISVPIRGNFGDVVWQHCVQIAAPDRSSLDVRISSLSWIYVAFPNGVFGILQLVSAFCQQQSARLVSGIAGIRTMNIRAPSLDGGRVGVQMSDSSPVVSCELKRLEYRVNDMRPSSGEIHRATLSPRSYTLRNPACMQRRTTSPLLKRWKLARTTLRAQLLRLYTLSCPAQVARACRVCRSIL